MSTTTSESLAPAEMTGLVELRARLLHLHKTLLEMERRKFEKVFGRVSAGELLQLVINHAQFAWLRMISALVVEIDELVNREEPATPSDFTNLFAEARLLFTAAENEDFKTRYDAALQQEPAVVMAHSGVMQLLRHEIQTPR